jgi:hypothetical protein
VKTGTYGDYVEWTDTDGAKQRTSLKGFTGEKSSRDDIQAFLSNRENAANEDKKRNPNLLRVLNDEFSIRKSKMGPYVFYQTEAMQKPQFFNLKSFPMKDLYTCSPDVLLDWIKKNHF